MLDTSRFDLPLSIRSLCGVFTPLPQIEVAHAFAEVAKAYKPSWIINVGDNFYESGVT